MQGSNTSRSATRSTSWARRAAVLLLAGLALSCGRQNVSVDNAYSEIKPKEPLSEREQQTEPDNFVVHIHNVADARSSYKNYVELYVNDRKVAPPPGVDNTTTSYSYSMRLQEGLYDVRAEYNAVGAWTDVRYKIVPDEPVKILPGMRTVLVAQLDKDDRGGLKASPAHFVLRFETLAPALPVSPD